MLYWLRLSRGDLYASLGDKLLMKTFLRLLTWEINDSVTSMYSYAYFVQHEFFYYFEAVTAAKGVSFSIATGYDGVSPFRSVIL